MDCDKTNCLSGVPVKFNHALSSVVFGAIENVDGKTYRITGFEIEGTFIDEADFNENITETPAVAGVSPYSETSAPAWTNPSAAVAKNYAPSAFVAFSKFDNFIVYLYPIVFSVSFNLISLCV